MKEPNSKCYAYAVNYIYRYPKTEKELKTQLLQKGYSERDTDQAIEFLKYQSYVNDRKFTESYISGEVIRKGKPLFKVQLKLQHKGVERELIQEVIKEYEDQIQSGIFEKIRKDIEQYKRKNVEGFDIIQKLMRKGYRLDDIKDVINKKTG